MAQQIPADISPNIRRDSIKRFLGASLISKLVSLAVPFVVAPLAIRVLGELYAAHVALFGMASILTTANLGVGPALSFKITKYAAKSNPEEESKWFSSGLMANLLTGSLLSLIVLLAAFFLDPVMIYGGALKDFRSALTSGTIYLAAFCLFYGASNAIANMFIGYLQEYRVIFSITLSQAFIILATAPLLHAYPYVLTYLILTSASAIIFQVGAGVVLVKKWKPHLQVAYKLVEFARVKKLLVENTLQSFSGLGYIISRQVTLLMLSAMSLSHIAVGIAGTLTVLHGPYSGLLTMFASAVLPTLSNARDEKDAGWIWRTTRRLLLILPAIVIVATVVLYFFGPMATKFLYQEYALDATESVLLGLMGASTGLLVICNAYSQAFGKFALNGFSGIVHAGIGLLGGFLLMPTYGVKGYAVAWIVAETTAAIVIAAVARKQIIAEIATWTSSDS